MKDRDGVEAQGPNASSAPPASNANIGERAVQGAAWLGGGQMIRLSVSFLTQVFLARLLLPSDHGLFGMAYMAAELAQLFAAFGIGAAIIQKQMTDTQVLSSCFWVNVLIGLVIAVVMVALGPLVELYFRTAGVAVLMWPLAANMVVCATMVVPQALLTQRLQFREQMQAQIIGSLASAVAAIAAALSGAGVWTLAIQPLVGNLVTTLVMMLKSGWFPRFSLRLDDVRPLMKLSTQLLLNSFIEWIARSLPGLIIGRELGVAAAGTYALATNMTGVVVFQISSVITRVLFPTLAILRSDMNVMRLTWRKAASAIAVLAWPLMAGAVAVASDLIPVVFGAQWQSAIRPFQFLSAFMMLQCVSFTANTVLLAMGRTDLLLRLTLLSVGAFALALWVGALYGLDQAAAGYAIAGAVIVLLTFGVAARVGEMPVRELLQELRPWAQASLLTGLAMGSAAASMADLSQPTRLILCIVLGAVVYPALLMLFDRRRTMALWNDVFSRLVKR